MELWMQALVAKGLPLESHNQSFTAFLHHFFGGEPTPIFAQGRAGMLIGFALLQSGTIQVLSILWTVGLSVLVLVWMLREKSQAPFVWIAVLCGLLILPSHLVWKPYFVMGIPAAIVFLSKMRSQWWAIIPGILINFTGFDFVGYQLGGWLEGAALLLWVHLALVALVALKFKSGSRFLF